MLEEGVTLMPDNAQAHVLLGRFLLDQSTEKSIPEAQGHFEAALKIDPKNAVALAASGEAAYTQGDKATARKRFQEALAIDNTLAEARADLGRLLYEDNQNDRALKELERATQDAPKLGKGWFYLAFAQNKAGKGAAVVEKSLKKAVECQPDLAEANYQLGKIYVSQGKNELAIAAFKAAIASRPAYEEALLELARLTEPTSP